MFSSKYSKAKDIGISKPLETTMQIWLENFVDAEDREKVYNFTLGAKGSKSGFTNTIQYKICPQFGGKRDVNATLFAINPDVCLLCTRDLGECKE